MFYPIREKSHNLQVMLMENKIILSAEFLSTQYSQCGIVVKNC